MANEVRPNRFCVECGTELPPESKFCVHCGAARAKTSNESTDATVDEPEPAVAALTEPVAASPQLPPRPVPLPVSPPAAVRTDPPAVATEPASAPLLSRAQMTVLVIGVVVVVVATAALLWTRRDSSSSGAAVSLTPVTAAVSDPGTVTAAGTDAPNAAAAATTAPPTSGPSSAPSTYSQIDAAIATSAAQRTQLQTTINAFQSGSPCSLSAADAAAQTGTIIDQRKALVASLDSLAASADTSSRPLVTQLRNAVNLSLQSDYSFQSWMSANADTDGTAPCARRHDVNFASADSIGAQAGNAKQSFVAAYDPVASGLGLRANWVKTDF